MTTRPYNSHPSAGDLSADAAEEAGLLRALATAPAVTVPDDFAARVAALAATRPVPQTSRWRSLGLRAALACSIGLLLALVLLAPHTTPAFHNLRFDLECLLGVELACCAYVLGAVDLRS